MRSRCAISTASRSAKAPARSPGFASPAASCRDSRSVRSFRSSASARCSRWLRAAAPSASCAASTRAFSEIYHAAYERQRAIWRAVHEPSLCAPDCGSALPGAGMARRCGSGFSGLSRRARATLCRTLAGDRTGSLSARARHRRSCRAAVRSAARPRRRGGGARLYEGQGGVDGSTSRRSRLEVVSALYRRMTQADLDAVVDDRARVHAHPWTPRQLRRLDRERASLLGRRASAARSWRIPS